MVEPAAQRAAVAHLQQEHGASERRACRLVGVARSTRRYQPQPQQNDGTVRERLRTLSRERPRYGYRRLTALLEAEGTTVNHKKVHRLCREEHLLVPRTRRMKLTRNATTLTKVKYANQRWAMDFVSDSLADGRTIRCLTLVDCYTRECLALEVDLSLPGERVRRVLERVVAERGRPEEIRVDNVLTAKSSPAVGHTSALPSLGQRIAGRPPVKTPLRLAPARS